MDFSRRDLLRLSGLAVAGTVLAPSKLPAQTPKRGGTLTLRVWDLKNYGPNLGYDYGGRLMAAWLDR